MNATEIKQDAASQFAQALHQCDDINEVRELVGMFMYEMCQRGEALKKVLFTTLPDAEKDMTVRYVIRGQMIDFNLEFAKALKDVQS